MVLITLVGSVSVSTLRARDVKTHDEVIFRQGERIEELLWVTSRFGDFVRKIVWNRRFIVTLSFLGLFAHLFWVYLMFF